LPATDYRFFVGLEQNEYWLHYPGNSLPFRTEYTPLQRPWYHKAQDLDPEEVIFGEPYIQLVPPYRILETASTPLYDKGKLIGVVGYDFDDVFEKNTMYNSIKFKESGFAVLVSSDGTVISRPPIWDTDELAYRVYKDDITGINFNMWMEIVDNSISHEARWFIITNNTDFTLRRAFSYHNGKPLYIIIGCYRETEVMSTIDKINEDIEVLYGLLYDIVMAVGFITFVVVTFNSCLLSNSINKFYRVIDSSGQEVIEDALNPNLFIFADLDQIEARRDRKTLLGRL
jgi:hypothetical protein